MQKELDPSDDPYYFLRQLDEKERRKDIERLARQSPLKKFFRWILSFIWY